MFAGVSFQGKCETKASADTKAPSSTDAADTTKAAPSTDAAKKANKALGDAATDASKKANKALGDAATDASKKANKALGDAATDASKKANKAVGDAKAKKSASDVADKAVKVAKAAHTDAEIAAKKLEVNDLATQCPGDKFKMDCEDQPHWATYNAMSGVATAKAPKSKTEIVMKCKISKHGVDGKTEEKDLKVTVLPYVHVCPVVAKCDNPKAKAGCKRVDMTEVDSNKCPMFPCGKIVCA